eukprot:2185016-Alexandrium_andersonii.AAC.1
MNAFMGGDEVVDLAPTVAGSCHGLYIQEESFTLPVLKQLCVFLELELFKRCLLYTSPSPRD